MTPLVEVRRLSASYGDLRVLRDVSLELHASEIVGLIGANGAGKTTLLRTLSGLRRPDGGEILLGGEQSPGVPHEIVDQGVVLVPEGRRLWPRMSVLDNLLLGAYSGRARRRTLSTSLDRVFQLFPRLGERKKQLAGTLSGGEQQMVAIGRALMSAPRVLLLDEPSLGLAPVVVDEVFDAVARIAEHRVAILLVEQNLHQALSLSERAYVLEAGKMVKEGKSDRLASDPEIRETYLGI